MPRLPTWAAVEGCCLLFRTSRGCGLFIHVPKTGGNTIQQGLLNRGMSLDQVICSGHQDGRQRFELRGPITETKHQSLQRYYQLSSDAITLPVVVCVRRPFERLVSLYFSPHRWLQWCPDRGSFELPRLATFDEAAFLQMAYAAPAAFDYLASGLPSPKLLDQDAAEKSKNIENLISGGRLSVLKTESLSIDYAACFGFPLLIDPCNVSPYRLQALEVLANSRLRAMVEDHSHHGKDLSLFYQ